MTVPVQPTVDNTHIESNFGKLLEPGLRKIFYGTYDEIPEQFSKVFKVKSSKKAKETDYGVGTFGSWTKRADGLSEVTYQTIPAGLERTYTHEEFLDGFLVERKFYDDEMYGVINKLPAELARAGRTSVEELAFQFLSEGFNKDFGGVDANLIYDGKALFATDHPTLAGGTYSNIVTGALSDTTLKSALLLLAKTPNEADKVAMFRGSKLVVPRALEHDARVILNSTHVPGSANNDINTLVGKLKLEVVDYLKTDTEWYVMDEKRHELNFFWRVKPEFKHGEEFDNLVAKYRGYMRFSFGCSDARGIVGSKGI